MRDYIVGRLLQAIPVLFGVSLLVFLLLRLSGDPAVLLLPEDALPEQVETLRRALGLDRPLHEQYLRFLGGVLRGDFGRSFRFHTPALKVVLERLPLTLELTCAALVVGLLLAVPLGAVSAVQRNSLWDLLAAGASVLGRAMPNFWLGLMLMLLFAVKLCWLPVSGAGGPLHLVLPALTLGTGLAATLTRLLRSSMLEVIRQDYIVTARSKGLSERVVVYRHALRNALIPVITVLGMQAAFLMGGAVVTERVFAWSGMGQLAVQALQMRDMAVVQAVVFVSALIIMAANLLVDLIYVLIDPRIAYR